MANPLRKGLRKHHFGCIVSLGYQALSHLPKGWLLKNTAGQFAKETDARWLETFCYDLPVNITIIDVNFNKLAAHEGTK